ncbi:hypothetical protein [Treponema brennaborense]|uniref:Uncharacterized protein n=1 Tax=Treponema brennaborense (strain DSM 12168 / CIP 105900 / DD5/3) TaxID=906968 RepID=F4LJH3_TREBD|nr:hypothetical protein [Treponema brennaborense]AEE16368.1 hypothetical protein Trebr_0932 [Treponema brennaborense DSM 12168]
MSSKNKKNPERSDEQVSNKKLRSKLTLRGVLSVLVIAVIVRQLFAGDYESVFMGVLTLVLFAIPVLIDRKMGIDIPSGLEAVILCFIFAAEILGEVDSFYTKFKHWDTMLHTVNGFLMAAVGFALVDIFNRSDKFAFKLSPFFLAITAFCFSMTVGVLWEFFEFGMDMLFNTDMQKDYIVTQINSVKFNPDGLNIVSRVPVKTLVVNGEDWISRFGGYIDIGLIDTMKDLFVNFIGAVIFSVIGFFYVKNRGNGKFAKQFIPTVKPVSVEELSGSDAP